MSYAEGKERARKEAIEWQAEFSDHFTKLAKRYGLIREFRENGII